mmetsp:Transcript_112478/g.195337  ORF Transcript_112478/g.195337 Transcript_112478/m.195337 type:complete len:87 (-) Transcript_112478:328-588(-)
MCRQMKADRVWHWLWTHPDNTLIHPTRKTDEELARVRKLMKSMNTVKANLGTWKPTYFDHFPPWETLIKCTLFSSPNWAPFVQGLG